MMATGTDDVRTGWFRPRPTNWKRPLCAASGASWSRPAWPVAARRSRFSKLFVVRTRWVAMTHAPADRARNTRSATGPRRHRIGTPSLIAVFDDRVEFMVFRARHSTLFSRPKADPTRNSTRTRRRSQRFVAIWARVRRNHTLADRLPLRSENSGRYSLGGSRR